MSYDALARFILSQEALRDALLSAAGHLCDLVAALEIAEDADEIAAADDREFENRVTDLLRDGWGA